MERERVGEFKHTPEAIVKLGFQSVRMAEMMDQFITVFFEPMEAGVSQNSSGYSRSARKVGS